MLNRPSCRNGVSEIVLQVIGDWSEGVFSMEKEAVGAVQLSSTWLFSIRRNVSCGPASICAHIVVERKASRHRVGHRRLFMAFIGDGEWWELGAKCLPQGRRSSSLLKGFTFPADDSWPNEIGAGQTAERLGQFVVDFMIPLPEAQDHKRFCSRGAGVAG